MNILSAQSLLSAFGVVGVGVVLFAETGLLIGFFLPGDSLLFTAGLLGTGSVGPDVRLSLGPLLIAAAVGALAGAQWGYLLGRKAGGALLARGRSPRSMVVTGRDGAPLLMDHGLPAWSMDHRPEVAVSLARGLTATGTGVTPYLLVAVAGAVVGRTLPHRLLAAASGLACLGAGQALRYGVMTLIARARPPQTDWDTHASGWSFARRTTSCVPGQHGGAGLGLPLARRLARSAGGEVSYDSGHAPGARFMVRLPSG
ncbi:hypothetical protein ACFW95_17060 [Streptomyces sp. NPDC059474]|uniref:hypothetical protein n=1 Tax=Streptomyces sp. NPDC059474 TaxID=3346846 RepID=UPI0036CD8518